MREFFNYQSPYRTGVFLELNVLEFTIPIILLIFLVFLIVYYKDFLRNNLILEKKLRTYIGVLFLILYSSHYIFRLALYGFDTIVIPFHLCSISMFFAIILLFTKNQTIYSFVLYTGVIGGIISLLTPIIGYNSAYYRYYQFYGAHLLLILTPIYFMVVQGYYPTKKNTIQAFLILQSMAVFMTIFNYFMGTDFMFLFIDPSKISKFPAIATFGGIPWYLIYVEIVGIASFYLMYRLTLVIKRIKSIKEIEYKEA